MLNDEQFCISTVYIIRMTFSASNNFIIIVVTVVVPRRVCVCVCVCLFIVFCRHVHLDPNVRVHRGTENSFLYYNRVFAENALLPLTTPEPQNMDTNGIHATWA